MNRFQVGVVLESTGLALRPAIEQASRWGVDGLQADGVGPLAAKSLSDTGRREFRNLLKSYNLELSAIGCPIRFGLDDTQDLQKRIDNIRDAMQLAFDLGARKVVVPFPKLSTESESPRANALKESLLALSSHGDRVGTIVCLEVGLDDAAKVRNYLKTFDTGCLQINFDPANFLMNGFDPLASAITFAGTIGHTHARDARRSATSGPQEVAVGAGDIEWMSYIATLESIDYRGYLTVERTIGENKANDIAASVGFLRRFAPRDEK